MRKLKWRDAKKELGDGFVFLQFTTSWCPDCRMMEPVIAEVERELEAKNIKINFISVDAEEAALFRTNSEWEILKVPSFFMIHNGQKTHIGYEYIPAHIIIDTLTHKYFN